ncbi:hypothetical protein R1T16_17395 [Flavobacterium sp. DG1-102-2]|uniref:hypothetical protein n=1 Tax=Flavobacterium sp. DG1-102-2 TaxID=3081663 RepID=UPI00294A70A1|nr:hypothetical protein [Flavobacterium sp. DG1-102-2]MDV6170215.1 hypothetical protein [Flavobacterium sp. DG1-102-2]
MNSIEIIIHKEADGSDIDMENMSVEAANMVIELLTALRNIATFEGNPDITVGLKEGSVCQMIQDHGAGAGIDSIKSNFVKVYQGSNERSNVYVNNLRVVQKALSSELDVDINFVRGAQKVSVKRYFTKQFKLRKVRDEVEQNFHVEFFDAKLKLNGGDKPNFHVERAHSKFTVDCTEEQARKIGLYLYQQVKFSAWAYVKKDKIQYQFCDLYNNLDRDYYIEFKSFFQALNAAAENDAIKSIHYKLKDFYSNYEYKEARKFIRLFCYKTVNPNFLMSILIISKAFKDNEDLKDMLAKVEDILSKITKRQVL